MNRTSFLSGTAAAALILTAPCAFANPSIASVSGNVTQGATITITGSGFGTVATASPIYYDNFSSYADGDSALSTGLDQPNGVSAVEPYVDSTKSVSGGKSLLMKYPLNTNGLFPEIGLNRLSLTQVYVSAWLYWERTAGSGSGTSPIVKLVRAESNPWYHGYPGFYETIRPNASGAIIATDRGSVSDTGAVTNSNVINSQQTSGAWHHVEYYYELSDPGVADGLFQTWVDGVKNADITNTMSRSAGSTATINNVISVFDGISNYGSTNAYSFWMDNFYVSATPARVELGDAATLTACKRLYIQPTTQWSTSSISATVETNTFSAGTHTYLYVFDASNNANATGFPVTSGGGTLDGGAPDAGLGTPDGGNAGGAPDAGTGTPDGGNAGGAPDAGLGTPDGGNAGGADAGHGGGGCGCTVGESRSTSSSLWFALAGIALMAWRKRRRQALDESR